MWRALLQVLQNTHTAVEAVAGVAGLNVRCLRQLLGNRIVRLEFSNSVGRNFFSLSLY
jgi:hypothetical protein